MRQAEFQDALRVHFEEQFELGGQLVGLLPLGGELGSLLVIVMIRQLFAGIRVPAEGPEAVQMDLLAHRRGQREHQDASAQTLRRQMLGLPIPADREGFRTSGQSTKRFLMVLICVCY